MISFPHVLSPCLRQVGGATFALLTALAGWGTGGAPPAAVGAMHLLHSAELQWTMPESVPTQITKSVQSGPGPITELYRQNAKRQIAEMLSEAQSATRDRLNAAQVSRGKEAIINIQPLRLQFNGMGPGGEFQITVYSDNPSHQLPTWQGRFDVHAKPEDRPRAMGSKLADAALAALQHAGLVMAPPAAGSQPLATRGANTTAQDPAP